MLVKNTAIIAGSTGTLGPQITEELKSRGFAVHGGSRSKAADFQYTGEQLTNTQYWYERIREYAQNSSTVLLINTIGQAYAPQGSTLEDVNIRPVVALAQAGKLFAQEHPEIKVVVVQISAIAAIYLQNDAYGESRAAADQKVVTMGVEDPLTNYKTLALQLPFIFVEPKEDAQEAGKYIIKGLHPWSMEQISGLPVVPLAGSGNQVIYPVALKDVTEGVAKAVNIEESQAIEVKGGSGLTQRQLVDFYAQMRKKNIIYIPVPSSVLGVVLDQFPYGLLAGYAPRVMANIPEEDTRKAEEPFDKLLGRPAQSIEAAHQGIDAKSIELAAPPVKAHLQEHAGKITTLCLATLAVLGGLYYFSSDRS